MNTCDPVAFLPILVLLCIGLAIFLIISSFTGGDKIPEPGQLIPAIMGTFVGGVILLVCVVCWINKRAAARMAARKNAIDPIIKKYQEGVFGSKNCIVRIPPYQTYVAIEFKWRAPVQAQPGFGVGMNPALMAQYAAMNGAGAQINPWAPPTEQQKFMPAPPAF